MSKRQLFCMLVLFVGITLIAGCGPFLQKYTLTVSTNGEGLVAPTGGQYMSGSTVTITATPKANWKFDHWSGDATGNQATISVVMNTNKNLTAHFVPTQNTAIAKWNFLVYLDGDNDLEMYGIEDINEMEEIGSTQDINILVLVDRHPQYDTSNGNWTGTRLYRITKDVNNSANIVSELVKDYGELDMSDPKVLENFMLTSHQAYPAERTILTLWDHGDGVYPKSTHRVNLDHKDGPSPAPITVEGICWDDTTGTDPWDCLTTDEIASALANVRQVTGKKVDILNMDACLMQTLEVAYEWRNEVNYLVGSQETVPGGGNNYETLLAALKNNPTISTSDFAKTLVNDYYQYYSANGEGLETYSALSLGAEFDNLIIAFKAFATALYQTTDLDGVYKAWNDVTWFTVYSNNDLYDLAGQLITNSQDANVRSKATALQQAIGNAVIIHKETTQYQGKAFGLSILLASADEWVDYSESNQYVSLLLSRDTDWDEFILRFVNYSDSTTPTTMLSVAMTWPSGDCDLGIWEPDDEIYWVDEGPSPNGVFSEDQTNGGTENWNLNATYEPGYYTPLVYSYDYTGSVNFKVTFQGQTFQVAVNAIPGEITLLEDLEVQSVNGTPQLRYNVVHQAFPMRNKLK